MIAISKPPSEISWQAVTYFSSIILRIKSPFDFSSSRSIGGGAPASAFVPNPSSPGEGSVDPTDQPAAPDGFGTTPSATPGAGVGSQLSPKAASAAVSAQTLGDYGFGKGSS